LNLILQIFSKLNTVLTRKIPLIWRRSSAVVTALGILQYLGSSPVAAACCCVVRKDT